MSSLIATGTPSSGRVVAGAAARVGLVGLGERLLGEHDAVGVELRVEALDAVEVGRTSSRDDTSPARDELGLAGRSPAKARSVASMGGGKTIV